MKSSDGHDLRQKKLVHEVNVNLFVLSSCVSSSSTSPFGRDPSWRGAPSGATMAPMMAPEKSGPSSSLNNVNHKQLKLVLSIYVEVHSYENARISPSKMVWTSKMLDYCRFLEGLAWSPCLKQRGMVINPWWLKSPQLHTATLCY